MPPSKQILAVVLAAGRSERFGATKLAAAFEGEPLVRRALRTARDCLDENVLLVAGHDAHRVIAACDDTARFIVINERFERGIGTSIGCATRVLHGRADAMLLLLADQPLISAKHLDALCDAWDGADNSIVATAFANVQGPPVLLPKGCFADLAALEGDEGARALLRDDRFSVTTVWNDAAAVDIDTPEDLDQAAS